MKKSLKTLGLYALVAIFITFFLALFFNVTTRGLSPSAPAVATLPAKKPTVPKTPPSVPVAVLPAGPIEKSFMLPELAWIPQTFNNCGPATTAMVLEHFDIHVSQATTRAALRTNPDDKNVFTYEIQEYLKTKGVGSQLLYNGNVALLKRILANGYYVIVEDLFTPDDDIGHDIIVRGYDDAAGIFIVEDSYYGPTIEVKYATFDAEWKGFNREYLPVYLPKDEPKVAAIIGADFDRATMFQHSVAFNLAITKSNPKDMYAWFDLGTSYFGLQDYTRAAAAFDASRALGWPMRMLWYQIQPVQTYNEIGRFQTALDLARKGLVYNDSFAELHYESAVALKGLGKTAEARAEAEKTLVMDPDFQKAKNLLATLQGQ